MATETKDLHVYQRANIRTPAEDAFRDFQGQLWLKYLTVEYAKVIRSSSSEMVWLKTTGSTNTVQAVEGRQRTVSVASNPVGWDDDDDGNDDCTASDSPSLSDLERVTTAIVGRDDNKSRVVIIESLTPFLMRHGLARTQTWLRRLLEVCRGPVIVSVLLESLTPQQHQSLEDMAQAVLYAHQGELTWIRQGVRERGNLLRESIPFEIRSGQLEIVTEVSNEIEDKLESTRINDTTVDQEVRAKTPSKRHGKVTLKLEEDDKPRVSAEQVTPSSEPRIFVEDDDPEFDDMDEEDPDDDLDI